MRVLTYHYSSSNSVGGVQELLRQLQELSARAGCLTFLELYDSVKRDADIQNNYEKKRVDKINLYSDRRFFKGIRRRLAFRRFIGCSDFDKLVVFNPIDVLFVPYYIFKRRKVILVQINRLDVQYGLIARILFHLFYNKLVYLFCVYTEADKSSLIKHVGVKGEKVKVIPRGCKLPALDRPKERSFRLVTICRIYESQKNLTGMLRVLDGLPDCYTLDIYGVGSEEEVKSLQELIKGEERAAFKGLAVDVKETLRNYSLFLMTSRYEGFGQTLIEARSQGLPVVAYDTFDAASWIVKDGETGWLVPYGNESMFVDKVKDILADENRYGEFSRRSLNAARETDKDYVADLWLGLLLS